MPPAANPNPDRARRGASVSARQRQDYGAVGVVVDVRAPPAAPLCVCATHPRAAAGRQRCGAQLVNLWPDSLGAALAHEARAIADKLVYAHEALHLEQKMQDAGWAADIERWESDTDSEGSDEEVDFKEGSNLSNTQVLALCM